MSAGARRKETRGAAASMEGEPFRSASTATLPRLLHDLGFSLVVSTYQTARVVIAHAPSASNLHLHFSRYQRPMGIAVGSHRLALGCGRAVWDFRNQPALGAAIGASEPYDGCWVPRNVHFTGHIGVHEIAFAGDELWVVNTLFSALCTLDEHYSVVPRWFPRFITSFAPEDRCHLNGLAVRDGRVAYVTAFSETDAAHGWRALKRPAGVIIDVQSKEVICRGLVLPHSPRWYQDRLWVLESGKGTLAAVDLRNGSVDTIAEVPGFARGLAFCGPFAFIGLSRVRKNSVLGDMPLLHRLAEHECGVWVVDIRNGATVGFLRFQGEVQEVFDVQLSGFRHPILLDARAEEAGSVAVPDPARPGAPVGIEFHLQMHKHPEESLSVSRRR